MRSATIAAGGLVTAVVLGFSGVSTASAQARLAGFVPAATTAPATPTTPASSAPTTSSVSPTAAATPAPSIAPRPDPEGDQWLQLALIGGGALLGAVVIFLVIGSLMRLKYRREARRYPR